MVRERKNSSSLELTVGTAEDIGLHGGFVAMVVGVGLDREFYKVVPGTAIFQIGRDGPSEMSVRT